MKEIREVIDQLSTNINQVNDDKYKEMFKNISFVLDSLSDKIEEVRENQAVFAENLKYLDDDLSDIQEELFEEVSLEELDEIEDEYKEMNCTKCGKPIYIESSALKENKEIPCPYCGENIIDR